MPHERGHLQGVVTLVHVHATGIHHHGHAVELTHENREAMALHRDRLRGEPIDVAVRDVSHHANALTQRTQTAAQHDGERMLHGRLAPCGDFLKRLVHDDRPFSLHKPEAGRAPPPQALLQHSKSPVCGRRNP